jgi:hypothetical protein
MTTRALRSSVFPHAAVLLLLGACSGTSTGNPGDGDPDAGKGSEATDNLGGAYANCKATPTDLDSLDAETGLGFSAREMLALAKAEREVSMEWLDGELFESRPAPQLTRLSFTITPLSAPARLVRLEPKLEPKPNDDGTEIGTLLPEPGEGACPDHLELDVRVAMQSDDGGLDERFDATLFATHDRSAQFVATIKAAELGGTFAIVESSGAAGAFELDSVQVNAAFSKLGLSGGLGATLVSEDPGGGSSGTAAATHGAVARWPGGSACDATSSGFASSGVARGVEVAYGEHSLAQVIELVNAENTFALDWQHTPATALETSFTADGEAACARYGVDDSGNDSAAVELSIAGKLRVQSADGRIDGSWPMYFTAFYDDSAALQRARVTSSAQGSLVQGLVDIADFERTYGLKGATLAGYDQANVLLTASWELAGGTTDPTASGTLTIQGAIVPECVMPKPEPEPQPDGGTAPGTSGGSSGCQGIDLEELETATLSRP